jgi:hypothetical protein
MTRTCACKDAVTRIVTYGIIPGSVRSPACIVDHAVQPGHDHDLALAPGCGFGHPESHHVSTIGKKGRGTMTHECCSY